MNKYISEWLASVVKRRRVLKELTIVEYITQHDEAMYDLAAYDTWLTWREPRDATPQHDAHLRDLEAHESFLQWEAEYWEDAISGEMVRYPQLCSGKKSV